MVWLSGKPTKPKGPIEVHDVYEDSCIIEWKPPEDDGGEPIDCYEIEKMDEATGRWVVAGRSKDGTSFKVEGLQKGHQYQFRVKAINREGASDPLQTDKATLARNPYGKIFLSNRHRLGRRRNIWAFFGKISFDKFQRFCPISNHFAAQFVILAGDVFINEFVQIHRLRLESLCQLIGTSTMLI